MLYLNSSMQRVLAHFYTPDVAELAVPLKQIVDSGFTYISGMCFFQHMAKRIVGDIDCSIVEERYGDRSGFENSMNRLHLDDYLEQDVIPQALALFEYVIKTCDGLNMPPAMLVLGVNITAEFGEQANLSFYLSRAGEEVLDLNNIQDYIGAMMVHQL